MERHKCCKQTIVYLKGAVEDPQAMKLVIEQWVIYPADK